jgi:nitroimidazol reductase NimA-like FMN-containing flavoprotein (pyridoxamine 5'-phosphate oxidase superfamily)
MTSDEIWRFVEDGRTGIFVTLRRDGMPIATPVWYAAVDRVVYISTRGKKLARVRNDPRASFLIESGERWAELKAVCLTGKAEIVEPSPELRERIGAELGRKYAALRTSRSTMPRETQNAYERASWAMVRFTPDERILNWDNAKLGLD